MKGLGLNQYDNFAIAAFNFKPRPCAQYLGQKFIDYAGRIIPCRSSYTGMVLHAIGGALPQALPCLFLNATMPEIALRQWLLLRKKIIKNHQLSRQ